MANKRKLDVLLWVSSVTCAFVFPAAPSAAQPSAGDETFSSRQQHKAAKGRCMWKRGRAVLLQGWLKSGLDIGDTGPREEGGCRWAVLGAWAK